MILGRLESLTGKLALQSPDVRKLIFMNSAPWASGFSISDGEFMAK